MAAVSATVLGEESVLHFISLFILSHNYYVILASDISEIIRSIHKSAADNLCSVHF